MFDLVISGGTVVDGTGAAPFPADVAVRDGRIVEVRPGIDAAAAERLDATGCVVTPGFVDVHTHYDGQVTWDDLLEPSSSHGVTTVAAGNCGVGFAPVRPGQQGWLVQLMEGVEDIPGTSLHEGIQWAWESFPQYLDALEGRRWSMDVATFVPHGAVRAYVMGERGAANEAATADDAAAMARLVQESIEAGAFGFSTSRTFGHKARDGRPVPGTYAAVDELLTIARGVRAGGGGLLEFALGTITPEDEHPLDEVRLVGELAEATGLPATWLLLQTRPDPTGWRRQLDTSLSLAARGVPITAQVAGRPFGVLLGFPTYHPFSRRPTYRRLAATLPSDELIAELLRPAIREAILAEADTEPIPNAPGEGVAELVALNLDRLYTLGDDVDYEPGPERSVAAIAAARGVDPLRLVYELCCEHDGRNLLLLPFFGYADGDHSALYEMLTSPGTVLGLADGGAHCRLVCDASQPTTMLTHWIRDRVRGPKIDLATAVKRQTSETAALIGLTDRGRVASGLRADLNVVDLDGLRLHRPHAVDDLPAGGRRLLQQATGYVATVVAGAVTRRNGVDTGARPGRLLRRH